MKTVQSHVLSSAPISLSDATSFLSDFTASVCGGGGRQPSVGASHETCYFVRRASASFQELDQLHRKLRDPRSDRIRRPIGSDTQIDGDDAKTTVGYNPAHSFPDVSSKHRQQENDDVTRKVKVEEEIKVEGDGGGIAEIDDKEKKKNKKKRENEIKEEEVKKEEKKRKSGVLETGEVDAVEEQQDKRKKRRKS